jgi:photosystem II stability/assembly factor-like uncharacterized protein
MTYPLPPTTPAARPRRPKRSSNQPNAEGDKNTPLWLMLIAIFLLLAGMGRLLSRPVVQWAVAQQPTPTPTLPATRTPTARPTATAAPVLPTPTPMPTSRPQTQAPEKIVLNQSIYGLEMIDEMRGWARGWSSVWHTDDGGLSWRNVTPAGVEAYLKLSWSVAANFFLDEKLAWFLAPVPGEEETSTLYRTVNAGRTWTSFQAPFRVAQLFFLDPFSGWALVSGSEVESTQLYSTSDGGETWTLVHNAQHIAQDTTGIVPVSGRMQGAGGLASANSLPAEGGLTGPVFRSTQRGWIGGLSAFSGGEEPFYETHDGGEHWNRVDLGLKRQFPGRDFYIFPPQFFGQASQEGVLPVFVKANTSALTNGLWMFFFSEDGGESWKPSGPLFVESGIMMFNVVSAREIFVLDSTRVYTSSDAAANWQPVNARFNNTLMFETRLTGVYQAQFVNRRAGWGWGWGNGDYFHLYRTQDGGKTWHEIIPEQLPASHLGCDAEVVSIGRANEQVTEPGPYEGWSIYTSSQYPFSLYYPHDWRLLEVFRVCPGISPTLNSVMILAPREQGGYMVIGFRDKADMVNITFPLPRVGTWLLADDSEGAAGEALPAASEAIGARSDPLEFFNETISRDPVLVNDELWAVYYARGEEIQVSPFDQDGMVFAITMLGSGSTEAPRPLLPEVMDLADQVVESFQVAPLSGNLLEKLDLSGFVSYSPDGEWQAETLFANSKNDGTPSVSVFQRVTLYSHHDNENPWIVLDRWVPQEEAGTLPGTFVWSPDGNYLYFAESGYLNGCSPFSYQVHLRKARLKARQVEEIALLSPDQRSSMAISPDTRRLAYLPQEGLSEDLIIRIRDLQTGEEQEIAFSYPDRHNAWVAGDLQWSPDSRRLVFSVAVVTCEAHERMGQVVLVDPQSGEVRYLSVPEDDNLRILTWDGSNGVIVEDLHGRRQRMDMVSGARTVHPPAAAEAARTALERFLIPLSYATLQPGIYETVMDLYGGSWDELAELNSTADPDDRAGLLRLACEKNGFHCLKIRSILSESALSNTHFRFVVELMDRMALPLSWMVLAGLPLMCGAAKTSVTGY